MANSVEHKVPLKIQNLSLIQHPDYRVMGVVGTGVTEYFPPVKTVLKPVCQSLIALKTIWPLKYLAKG